MTLYNLLHMYKVLEEVTELICTVHYCLLQQPAVSVPLNIHSVIHTGSSRLAYRYMLVYILHVRISYCMAVCYKIPEIKE